MEYIDILLTLAEIAIAIAGFASLASVISQTNTTTDPEVNAIRLRGLVNGALAAMFLALIGALLLKLQALGDWSWRATSLIGLISSTLIGWGVWKRDRPRRNLPGYNVLTAVTNFSIVVIVVCGFALNVFGVFRDQGPLALIVCIGLVLAGASTAFMLVINSLLTTKTNSAS